MYGHVIRMNRFWASNSWQSPYRLPNILVQYCISLNILCTHEYLSNTVYPVYRYISCLPCISLYILCTHVYPSNTVSLVYPCISCLAMFTLASNTVYPVYPYISCARMFTLVILYTLYILFTHVLPY